MLTFRFGLPFLGDRHRGLPGRIVAGLALVQLAIPIQINTGDTLAVNRVGADPHVAANLHVIAVQLHADGGRAGIADGNGERFRIGPLTSLVESTQEEGVIPDQVGPPDDGNRHCRLSARLLAGDVGE